MAHPSAALPKALYIIDAAATDVYATPTVQLPDGETSGRKEVKTKFIAVTCTVAGTLKVKGGSIFKYVDVSDSTSDFSSYRDGATGAAYASNAAMDALGDGFFQALETVEIDLPMIAGQTVYGNFDSLKSDGTFTGFAYVG
jgi:hypothetical protein